MKYRFIMRLVALLCSALALSSQTWAQSNQPSTGSKPLALARAVMCEDVQDYVPLNPAVVFSTSLATVSCFTAFDPVPEQTFVYHDWYYKDALTTRRKLSLHPPRWSTRSSIQLREADKGPWRVEITDEKGHIFHVLRFSIAD